jgi:hypothetical protein
VRPRFSAGLVEEVAWNLQVRVSGEAVMGRVLLWDARTVAWHPFAAFAGHPGLDRDSASRSVAVPDLPLFVRICLSGILPPRRGISGQ